MIEGSQSNSWRTETTFCSQTKKERRTVLLNDDVLSDILSRLPVKSLVRFHSVSRSWSDIIGDPSFTALHVKRSNISSNGNNLLVVRKQGFIKHITRRKVVSLLSHRTHSVFSNMAVPFVHNDKFLKIVGSCNGVLCLTYSFTGSFRIYLFNPATREFKKLPEPRQAQEFCDHEDVVLGFGHSPKTNDYKIITMQRYFQDSRTTHVWSKPELYSLNKDSWRQLDDTDGGVIVGNICKESLNGVLHWKAIRVLEEAVEGEKKTYKFIMAFDLDKEVFGTILLPEIFYDKMRENDWRAYNMSLFVSNQRLSMAVSSAEGRILDIWFMQKYGVRESWCKLSRTELSESARRVVGFGKNSEILYVNYDSKLILYDHSAQRTKALRIPGLSRWSWKVEVFNYTESPVAIKGEKLHVKKDVPRFMILFFHVFSMLGFFFYYNYIKREKC